MVSRTRSSSLEAATAGIQFGSFDNGTLAAGAPSTSNGLTTQVHTVQTRVGPAAQSAQVDTEMSAPHAVNAPDLPTNNGPHEADVAMEDQIPPHAATGQSSDGRAAEATLGGTALPRAQTGREFVAEGSAGAVATGQSSDGRVTFGSPVMNRHDQEEAEMRAIIAMYQLRLTALTSADARQPSTSADRPGPTVSILRNGLRECSMLNHATGLFKQVNCKR